jgi:hypothetical protein
MWNSKTSRLISPNGGQLVDLMVGTEVKDELKAFATRSALCRYQNAPCATWNCSRPERFNLWTVSCTGKTMSACVMRCA